VLGDATQAHRGRGFTLHHDFAAAQFQVVGRRLQQVGSHLQHSVGEVLSRSDQRRTEHWDGP
jgi:hypothetical protein